MSESNFKEWLKKYSTEKVVDFKDYLNSRDFELLKILDVIVEDKIYTLQEYDQILFSLFQYYTDFDEQKRFRKEDFIYLKSLEEKKVDREDFNKLLFKVMIIKYPQN